MAQSMSQFCKKHGIQMLLKESYELGIVDLKPLLMKVKALKPQVVFTTSYLLDGALLMRQAKEINLNAEGFLAVARKPHQNIFRPQVMPVITSLP